MAERTPSASVGTGPQASPRAGEPVCAGVKARTQPDGNRAPTRRALPRSHHGDSSIERNRLNMKRAFLLLATVTALVTALPGVAQAAAAGNARSFAFMSQSRGAGLIARWNPCAGPIDYRVNLDRA